MEFPAVLGVFLNVSLDLEGCRRTIVLHPLKGALWNLPFQLLISKGVSHFKLPLGRCRGTGGCRNYAVACRAAMGHLPFTLEFLQINSPPGFFISTGIRCGVDFAQKPNKSGQILDQRWKIFFVIFYETNSSQDYFFYCKIFGVDGSFLGMWPGGGLSGTL